MASSDLNKVMLIGRLGGDPEVKTLPSGEQVANFSLATSDKWKDKATGDKKEATEWHRIVIYGGLAKICGEYLKKGSQVYLEGKNRTRKWTDKGGVERYTTEVMCHEMKMLGRGEGSGDTKPKSRPTGPAPGPEGGTASGKDDFDDDIPF